LDAQHLRSLFSWEGIIGLQSGQDVILAAYYKTSLTHRIVFLPVLFGIWRGKG
jgi:hypothetical protein